ncbi:MAG: hypothetical protein L0Z55_04135 [Planctomycetes bacterium]|nr:hypothetical protein [Planctomycetota bacterium]
MSPELPRAVRRSQAAVPEAVSRERAPRRAPDASQDCRGSLRERYGLDAGRERARRTPEIVAPRAGESSAPPPNSAGIAPSTGTRKRFAVNEEMTRNLERRFGLSRGSTRGPNAATTDLPSLRRVERNRGDAAIARPGVAGNERALRGGVRRGAEPGAGARGGLAGGVTAGDPLPGNRTTRLAALPNRGALGALTSGATAPVAGAVRAPGAGIPASSSLDVFGTVGVSASGVFGGVSIYVPLYHRYRYRHYGYGYYSYYPFDWYCGYSSIAIGFPYFGYYSLYPYPYLYGYGCDFYSNFYVRFGHYRLSRYSLCDHYGHHHYGHYHSYHCHQHGYHYYHLRDCSLCYPYDSSYAIQEQVYTESAQAEEKVLDLRPGELSFCEGWTLLRSGAYDRAAEAFYNASVEIPESGIVQLYLAVALAGAGDYDLAGAAAAEAHRLNPALITYQWSASESLGSEERHRALVVALAAHGAANPNDSGAAAVQAMLELFSADKDFDAAGAAAVAFAFASGDSPLSEAILAEIDRREEGREVAPAAATRRDLDVELWLRRPACESIGTLSLGKN